MNAPVSYLKLSDGSTFIPIGVNLCFPRFINTREEGLAIYRRWIDQLSANGGNFFRIFLGHPFFDFEGEHCGDFRPELTTALREVLDMAAASGVKVKVTFDHFRSIEPKPVAEIFPGAAKFDRSKYHVAAGGVAENMIDYLQGEAGRRHFLSKLDFFALHFGNHPALFAVELWNEMNTVEAANWTEWTEFMLPELRRSFPQLLCLQSLGSHDRPGITPTYEWLARLPGLECLQVHRYIDELTGLFPLCSGPTDILAASSIRELRAMAPERALILAESGAVDPGHRAPFSDYPKDTAGGILHDVLFAPFFAGSAGAGQCWHWDFYLDKNNLWHHFRPFAAMVEGLDPAAEGFVPHFSENSRFRAYELRGKSVRLHWLRDASFDWKAELRDGQSAPLQDSEKWLPQDFLPGGQWDYIDPWESSPRWKPTDAKLGGVDLPQWRRSIILRQRISETQNTNQTT